MPEGLTKKQQGCAFGCGFFLLFMMIVGTWMAHEIANMPSSLVSSAALTASPKDLAIKNSIAYLNQMAPMTVLGASAVYNDAEVTGQSYPITVILQVRFPGPSPTGYFKRTAMFACAADGTVISLIQFPQI